MNALHIPSLILNEKEILRRLEKGELKEIPEYWSNIKILLSKLTVHFVEENVEDVVESVSQVFKKYNINFDNEFLKQEVEREIKEKEKSKYKDWKLRDIQEPLKIYKSEVEAISQLKTLPAKRLAFAILMLFKIDEYKHRNSTRENGTRYLNYEPFYYVKYAKTNESKTMWHELHQAKIITVPLVERGLYCNIISNGENDKVVYEIIDGFESSESHFNKVFATSKSKIILEVKIDTNDHEVHHGLDSINKKRKTRNEKTVQVCNVSQCIEFKKMSINGSYWVEIDECIEHDEMKINQIKEEIRRIAKSYRKLTKSIGFEGIKEEFDKFKDSL